MGGDDLMGQVLTFLAQTDENRPVEAKFDLVQGHDRFGQRMKTIAEFVHQLQLVLREEIVLVQNADFDNGLDDRLE